MIRTLVRIPGLEPSGPQVTFTWVRRYKRTLQTDKIFYYLWCEDVNIRGWIGLAWVARHPVFLPDVLRCRRRSQRPRLIESLNGTHGLKTFLQYHCHLLPDRLWSRRRCPSWNINSQDPRRYERDKLILFENH